MDRIRHADERLDANQDDGTCQIYEIQLRGFMNAKTTVKVILAAAVFQVITMFACFAGQFTPAQWTELAGEVATARTNGQHSTYAAWVRVTTQPLTNTVVEVVSTNRKPKLVAAENRYKNVLSSFGLTTADSFDDIYGTISA